jgi:hypothetical protein
VGVVGEKGRGAESSENENEREMSDGAAVVRLACREATTGDAGLLAKTNGSVHGKDSSTYARACEAR